jgi:CRISPR-associated protein Csx3
LRTILVPREWTPAFVDHVCESLAQRPLPLIVDAGGRPKSWQEAIFDRCTHAVLLTPDTAARDEWLARVGRHNLILLADLRSELDGTSQVTAARPVLEGVIAGLEWAERIASPTFDALVERIARLFAYDPDELRRSHLASAPVETTVDLERLAQTLGVPCTGDDPTWDPGHLPLLFDYLPAGVPLGLYGRGPNWLYAAAALLAHPASFYQFDARLGWVSPPELVVSEPSADALLRAGKEHRGNHTHLAFELVKAYLDYTEAEGLMVPPVSSDVGLVFSGKLPLWLYTALALTYAASVPWLAVYQPQLGEEAAVVASQVSEPSVGDRVVSPPCE